MYANLQKFVDNMTGDVLRMFIISFFFLFFRKNVAKILQE